DPSTQGIVRIDPRTGTVAKRVAIPLGVQDVSVGFGAVWVTNRKRHTVTRVDLKSGALKTVPVGLRPGQLALGQGYLWIANPSDDQVTRVDPKTFQTNTIAVGRGPSHIAVGSDGVVWV